jgi:formylglycine-generating enzyme required for sulfatase activity
MKTNNWMALVLAAGVMGAGGVRAGTLTPPGAPGATMHTLTELYEMLTNSLAEVQENQQKLSAMQQQVAGLEARLNADNKYISSGNMVLIPAGSFVMGATTNAGHENIPEAEPQHTVYISAIYMDKYEVSGELWREVATWANTNGYNFYIDSLSTNQPITQVAWFQAIGWCNARSVRDGFTPCYTNTDGTLFTYDQNEDFSFNGGCNWDADGYRLPTEAEWEKAARGGVAGRRFPWADANTIQHARANYYAQPFSTNTYYVPYDTSSSPNEHPSYLDTSPVGSFMPNGYGLYDMAGNAREWCWDIYTADYYENSPGMDPRGPTGDPSCRVRRGGYNVGPAFYARCADRSDNCSNLADDGTGFRCVRKP